MDYLCGPIKYHHKCPYKRKATEDNNTEEGNIKMEAEIAVMQPQSQECCSSRQQLEEAREDSPLDFPEKG